jgi:thiamine biosynthesis lipoprotein
VLLAVEAMATRFELVLPGEDQPRLRAAGEEALRLIQRLDAQLSAHRPTSDISRINRLASSEPVRVDPELFRLLRRARELHAATRGAFDITVGPLLHCWGLHERSGGHVPDAVALTRARRRVGMELVELDEHRRTVRFGRPGMSLDLGAIGKGYALDQAALMLRELGVTSALLHGGTSSSTAIGAPPAADAWHVAIAHPPQPPERGPGTSAIATAQRPLAVIPLRDRSLSVSAVWGKTFAQDDVSYGHVLDPCCGRPVEGALLAAVACDDGTLAEALSTALLVLGPERHQPVTDDHPAITALVIGHADARGDYRSWSRGVALRNGYDRGLSLDVA